MSLAPPPNVLVTAAVCSCKQLYQGRCLAFKMRFRVGLRPGPHGGELMTLPHTPQYTPPHSALFAPGFSRLWRLDFVPLEPPVDDDDDDLTHSQ